jgi:hypothetical protein
MSTYHKGEKLTDYYKLEDEIGRYHHMGLTPIIEAHLL